MLAWDVTYVSCGGINLMSLSPSGEKFFAYEAVLLLSDEWYSIYRGRLGLPHMLLLQWLLLLAFCPYKMLATSAILLVRLVCHCGEYPCCGLFILKCFWCRNGEILEVYDRPIYLLMHCTYWFFKIVARSVKFRINVFKTKRSIYKPSIKQIILYIKN